MKRVAFRHRTGAVAATPLRGGCIELLALAHGGDRRIDVRARRCCAPLLSVPESNATPSTSCDPLAWAEHGPGQASCAAARAVPACLALAAAMTLHGHGVEAGWNRGFAVAAVHHVLRIALAGFLLAGWAHAGGWVLRLAGGGPGAAGANGVRAPWFVRAAAGLALGSMVLFALAAAGLWTFEVFFALLIALAVLWVFAPGGATNCGTVGAGCAIPPTGTVGRARRIGPWEGAALALAIAYLLPSLATALAPPLGWDDQVYHLALPKAYLAAGGFVAQPWNMYAQQPGGLQMLFGFAMGLGDPMVAVLVHFMLCIAVCAGAVDVARRLGMRRGAWFAPLLFLCHYMVGEEAGWAFTDLGLGLFVLAAWWSGIAVARGRGGRGAVVALGLAAGAIPSIKYIGYGMLVVLALFWLAIVVVARFRPARRRPSLAGPILTAAVLAMLSPALWMIRNWMTMGNPLWPLASGLFPTSTWNDRLAEQLTAWQFNGYGRGRTVIDAILLLPRVFFESDYAQRNFAGALSPLPLVAAALGMLVAPPAVRRRLGLPLIAFGLLFALWGKTAQISRFLIPSLPLLAIGGAAAFESLFRRRRSPALRMTVLLILGVLLLHGVKTTLLPRARGCSHVLALLRGREPVQPWLQARITSYAAFRHLDTIPESERGSHVLFLYESMGFYARVPYRFDLVETSLTFDAALQAGDAGAFAARLRGDGVRFVLVNEALRKTYLGVLNDPPAFDPYQSPTLLARFRSQVKIVEELLATHAEPVFRSDGAAVYRLR